MMIASEASLSRYSTSYSTTTSSCSNMPTPTKAASVTKF